MATDLQNVFVEGFAGPDSQVNRPSSRHAAVAAAWALIAGCMRTVGQVTPTPTFRSEVACDRAPRTDQTNGL